jgi:hypothetical protein
MADETLYVIDRIVTKPGCGRQFVDALLDQYLPSAQRRGMTLADVLVSPPLWCDKDPNTLTVTWTVDGTAGWWSMTRQGRRDSTLRQWWDAMAPLIIERSRSMAAAAKDIEGLSNV